MRSPLGWLLFAGLSSIVTPVASADSPDNVLLQKRQGLDGDCAQDVQFKLISYYDAQYTVCTESRIVTVTTTQTLSPTNVITDTETATELSTSLAETLVTVDVTATDYITSVITETTTLDPATATESQTDIETTTETTSTATNTDTTSTTSTIIVQSTSTVLETVSTTGTITTTLTVTATISQTSTQSQTTTTTTTRPAKRQATGEPLPPHLRAIGEGPRSSACSCLDALNATVTSTTFVTATATSEVLSTTVRTTTITLVDTLPVTSYVTQTGQVTDTVLQTLPASETPNPISTAIVTTTQTTTIGAIATVTVTTTVTASATSTQSTSTTTTSTFSTTSTTSTSTSTSVTTTTTQSLVVATTTACADPAPTVLFEGWESNSLSPWTDPSGNSGVVDYTHYQGSYSLNSFSAGSNTDVTRTNIAVCPGATYNLQAYIQLDSTCNAKFVVDGLVYTPTSGTADNGWTPISIQFTTTPVQQATTIVLRTFCGSPNTSKWDNILLSVPSS